MHALRCVQSLVSLVFREVVFGGSASLLDLFLRFLAKCFFCNLYVGVGQPDRALTPYSGVAG